MGSDSPLCPRGVEHCFGKWRVVLECSLGLSTLRVSTCSCRTGWGGEVDEATREKAAQA